MANGSGRDPDDHDKSTKIERHPERLDPDALYDEGMAFYRRRRWADAKRCFEQLHALQPSRRGIEAMLRELEIFMQLESVESDSDGGHAPPPSESAEEAQLAGPAATPEPAVAAPNSRRRWWLAPVVLLASFVIVGLVYLVVAGPLSPEGNEESLRNQVQSYLVAQRFCRSLEYAVKLNELVPGDPEALNAIEKSKARLYEEAQDYIQVNDNAQALANLECVQSYDPGYKDTAALIEMLHVRAELAELYRQAREDYLDKGVYGEGINLLLQIRALDPDYRPGTIRDDLYEAHMAEARQWLSLVSDELVVSGEPTEGMPQYQVTEDTLAKLREASKAFDRALGERPDDETATRAKELAVAAQGALESYINWNWLQASSQMSLIYERDSGYLSGKLAALLCDSHLLLAHAYYSEAEFAEALAVYERIAAVDACDPERVATLAYQAALPLTPTATPTRMPSPTATLTPTATPTATATRTYTPRPTASASPTSTLTPTTRPWPTVRPSDTPRPTSVPQPTDIPTPTRKPRKTDVS
jgi:tetratricopeptide (TPR) repeat protein